MGELSDRLREQRAAARLQQLADAQLEAEHQAVVTAALPEFRGLLKDLGELVRMGRLRSNALFIHSDPPTSLWYFEYGLFVLGDDGCPVRAELVPQYSRWTPRPPGSALAADIARIGELRDRGFGANYWIRSISGSSLEDEERKLLRVVERRDRLDEDFTSFALNDEGRLCRSNGRHFRLISDLIFNQVASLHVGDSGRES